MKNNLRFSTLVITFFIFAQAQAAFEMKDLKKIRNDKEAMSISLKKSEVQRVREKFQNNELKKEVYNSFNAAVLTYLNSNNLKCEMKLIKYFEDELNKRHVYNDEETLNEYFKLLRVNNQIDDILFDFTMDLNKDYQTLFQMTSNKKATVGPTFYSKSKLNKNNDIKDLYRNFKKWSRDSGLCIYQEFSYIRDNLSTKHEKPTHKQKLKILRRLNIEAYRNKLISANTFRRLEYIRKSSFLNTRYIWLDDYFSVIFKAKNKMQPYNAYEEIINIEKEDQFSNDKLRRFSKLTRRRHLYEKYDETQIILLAKVLQKASRRMGVDPDVISSVPYITQEFKITNQSGEMVNYVERIELDPQSQYNLARRRMRKDILDLQVMNIFYKVEITYSEIVMAALETGYITHEDIEYVVDYDDLWNPKRTKFQRVMSFIFNTARISTFFVPAPFNITASIAITVVEGIVAGMNRKGADNENAASIID